MKRAVAAVAPSDRPQVCLVCNKKCGSVRRAKEHVADHANVRRALAGGGTASEFYKEAPAPAKQARLEFGAPAPAGDPAAGDPAAGDPAAGAPAPAPPAIAAPPDGAAPAWLTLDTIQVLETFVRRVGEEPSVLELPQLQFFQAFLRDWGTAPGDVTTSKGYFDAQFEATRAMIAQLRNDSRESPMMMSPLTVPWTHHHGAFPKHNCFT